MGKDVATTIRNPECTRCKKLCEFAKTVCMPGYGPKDADIMVVGEAPGEKEDERGIPYIGKAGFLLKKELLPTAGLVEEEIRFTNAVRCRPPNNRTPTIREIEACRSYLEAEIRMVQPKVVVLTGNVPLASALSFFAKDNKETKVSGITKWSGKVMWHREWNCWVIPMFHPSYVSRMRNQTQSEWYFERCVEVLKMAEELARKPRPEVPLPELEAVQEPKRFLEVAKEMAEAGTFAFDIETGNKGSRAWHTFVIGFSLACNGKRGYYIPWTLFEDRRSKVWEAFVDLMTNPKYLKIMHNGAYETRIFKFNDIPIRGQYHDTMVMAQLTDENFYKGLKDLSWVHTMYGGYERPLDLYKKEHKIKADYSLIPFDLMWEYGAMDSVVTYQLWERLLPQMREEGSYSLFSKILMPVRRVMSDAEHSGILVDEDRARELMKTGDQAMLVLEKMIYEEAGVEFNINSPKQLSSVLYDRLGLPVLKHTESGGISTDRSVVEALSEMGYPIGKLLSNRSYMKTMLGTHVSQAIEFMDPDSRVHPNYNLAGTVTGRTSCYEPSLQQVPRDKLVRSIYTVPEGWRLIEADLKSAELVYLAAVSGEGVFLDAFRSGTDLHNATWQAVKGLGSDYIPTQDERNMAKRVNFGLVYGISPVGLSKQLGITVDEAAEFVELYFQRLPKVAEWLEVQEETVKRLGYVESLFRRRRRLPMALSDIEYDVARAVRQATNAPIQSGAADYTYLGLVRTSNLLRRNRMRSRIIHTVHDCVLIESPEDEVERVTEMVLEGFEEPIKILPVRMKIEVEVNQRWGENNESTLEEIFKSTLGGNYVLAD